MAVLSNIVDSFWEWTGFERFRGCDITNLPVNPYDFPQLSEIQSVCIALINDSLSEEEMDAFLMCMAIDSECELILDNIKEKGCESFLTALVSKGVSYPQSETRWQMAELLRRNVPRREEYLKILLSDANPYVRKRACNVIRDDVQ